MTLAGLLAEKETVFLDGAMGTELHRLGVDIGLPLWSANALDTAPHTVRTIHFRHLHAGADVLTTNTFRTGERTLRRAGMSNRWEQLNLKAVEFAFEARDRYRDPRPVLVAGGLAPVEDCYAPRLAPPENELRAEHGRQAALLAAMGVDFLLVETMPCIREARAAAEACAATGRDFAVSVVCDDDGRLLSGETIADAVAALEPTGPAALLVNCVPARSARVALEALVRCTRLPAGCYANTGTPTATGADIVADVTVGEYADRARDWRDLGARIVGGCCGTTPEHLAAVVRALSPLRAVEHPAE